MTDQPHNELDEIIHQRTRLSIMATLAGVESLDFNELKARLGLTDGNLSTHMTHLEKAGYLTICKSFKNRKPMTTLSISPAGRKAFERYVNTLQSIIDKAKE